MARSVAPRSKAPASEVTRPPSNAATSTRPPALPNAIPVALHCVGIGKHPPSRLNSFPQNKFYSFRDPDAPQSGRVEDGRGGLGHAATLRFPSPLLKPDVRISRIRLSDWFQPAAHGGHRVRCVLPKQWAMADAPNSTDRCPSSPQVKASSEASGCSWVFQAHRQSPILGSVQSAPEVRALSSASMTWPQQSYGPLRLPSDPPPVRRWGCQPRSRWVSPDDPHHPSNVPCPLPRRIETGACVDCFPAHTAFPVSQAGRHPHLHFRGLLRLHARYGPLDRSTAQGGLCHEAPAQSVARPNRSSATRSIDNSLGGTFLHW